MLSTSFALSRYGDPPRKEVSAKMKPLEIIPRFTCVLVIVYKSHISVCKHALLGWRSLPSCSPNQGFHSSLGIQAPRQNVRQIRETSSRWERGVAILSTCLPSAVDFLSAAAPHSPTEYIPVLPWDFPGYCS